MCFSFLCFLSLLCLCCEDRRTSIECYGARKEEMKNCLRKKCSAPGYKRCSCTSYILNVCQPTILLSPLSNSYPPFFAFSSSSHPHFRPSSASCSSCPFSSYHRSSRVCVICGAYWPQLHCHSHYHCCCCCHCCYCSSPLGRSILLHAHTGVLKCLILTA